MSPSDEALRGCVADALSRARAHLAATQDTDGSWSGDYGGPMFLLPMYVVVAYFAGRSLPPKRRDAIARYLRHAQNPDGSVGLYEGGPGCLFTTALCHVALRLVGASADDASTSRMAAWVRDHGTPLRAASWGKFVLSLIDLYHPDGLSPLTPELWLLPYALPIHPGRLWCHARQVYLPMAWLYGRRACRPADALIHALRDELYGPGTYARIRWRAHRLDCAPEDAYRPPTGWFRAIDWMLWVYERFAPPRLRAHALEHTWKHILFEDQATHFIRIGPVNAVLNTAVHAARDPGGEGEHKSFEALEEYLWHGDHGLSMQGYNSSRLWDTAFAAQALAAAGEGGPVLTRALTYVRDQQIPEELEGHTAYYRDPSRGAWPFSNRAHGWPITDCTAEGFKCSLLGERLGRPHAPEPLLHEAILRLLQWQNPDGGYASYERQRVGRWIEVLNPSQVFGDIMTDTSFVECTGAVAQALAAARRRFPGRYDGAIDRALAGAETFLRSTQRDDGSWEGSWGVCFTYGTWFAVSGLRACGATVHDPALRRARAFLRAHQRPDGAWGEHPSSCWERRYVAHPDGQAVMTSWALLALLRAGETDRDLLDRAARFLVERQGRDGAWPRESIAGVFNRTCMINYDNYRKYFPLWALAEWQHGRPSP